MNELQTALEIESGSVLGVGCGWSHTLALVEKSCGAQTLFVFGSNSFGQLGISSSQSSIPLPLPGLDGVKVSSVACGLRHSAFTTNEGSLWLFGENRFAQCGVPTLESVSTPTRLDTPHHVSSISLGSRHTLFLTNQGSVYAFGENRFGQCGVDPATVKPITRPNSSKAAKDIIPVPQKVILPTSAAEMTKIRTGWNFSLVFVDGAPQRVYLFGRNNYGQLGLGTTSPLEWTPIELDLAFLCKDSLLQVECGSEHTLLLSRASKVYSFGWNDHGQLGHGDETDRSEPTLVSGLLGRPVRYVAAGYGFSFAIVDDL